MEVDISADDLQDLEEVDKEVAKFLEKLSEKYEKELIAAYIGMVGMMVARMDSTPKEFLERIRASILVTPDAYPHFFSFMGVFEEYDDDCD